jgi:competence protein ComEA
MSPPRLRSAPLAALAAAAALGAIVSLARHHDRASALEAERAHDVGAAAPVAEPDPLPSIEALTAPIDVNRASTDELERLPRIGPALAARIVAHRPFASVDELTRVPGIGPRTLEGLRAHAVAGPP